jgi:hemoglobin-like flavoprotein
VTPEAIDRIRASFTAITPQLGAVCATFYDRLFEVAPEVRRLFAPDMTRQRGHFEAALALLLRNVTMLDVLGPSLMALGAEHVSYGTRAEHYDVARECLIHAIRQHAGDAWSDELERDWHDAVTAVMQPMLRGAALATSGAAGRIGRPPD